ncbi:hypothetical protein THAOC_31677 [Thalassiosira oceanica]|uniref:Uncharacterized protein n=1 Tax=Thalassiosira oceanica TaxID=159749 RepID=K0R8R2_THAOC|nr:hypothetical protein THAOC_31677 [Thalassiosira oceanica]|eukprot:EJK49450.1 hypothetical protein THAOC_31677 [Thalassiosira oceanica]
MVGPAGARRRGLGRPASSHGTAHPSCPICVRRPFWVPLLDWSGSPAPGINQSVFALPRSRRCAAVQDAIMGKKIFLLAGPSPMAMPAQRESSKARHNSKIENPVLNSTGPLIFLAGSMVAAWTTNVGTDNNLAP